MSTWLDELFARREGKQASEVAVDSMPGILAGAEDVQDALEVVDGLSAVNIPIDSSGFSKLLSGVADAQLAFSVLDQSMQDDDLVDAVGSIVIGSIARHTGNVKLGKNAGEHFNHFQSNSCVMVGQNSGRLDERAERCTAVGADAGLGWESGLIEYRTAIGSLAICTADNSIRLGRAGSDEVYGGTYHTDSDERFKSNIAAIGPKNGIDFIEALQPVTFEIQGREGVTHFGFIAQEVAGALAAAGVGPNGIHSVGGVDPNLGFAPESINYSALIAPLVQAVQELSERVRVLEMERSNV